MPSSAPLLTLHDMSYETHCSGPVPIHSSKCKRGEYTPCAHRQAGSGQSATQAPGYADSIPAAEMKDKAYHHTWATQGQASQAEGCAPAVMVQILKVAMMLGWLRLVASSASRSIFCSASDIDSLIPGECSTTLMATSVLRHRPA